MRQIVLSGSVKAFWINNKEVINTLKKLTSKAKSRFPEICEIWLFGSFAKNETTGLSDIDLLIVADTKIENPIERIKPYYFYFSDYLDIGIDIIVAKPEEKNLYSEILSSGLQLQ